MLSLLRASLKLAALILVLLALGCYGAALGRVIEEPARLRKLRVRALSFGARIGVTIFGLRDGERARLAPRGAFLVANHLSYLDVVAIAARQPTAFITSREVRDTPFVGWLTRATGCLHVERRSRAFLPKEIAEIAAALKAGISVTLFPEGTSSDGSHVLPFRAALLDAARDAQVPIAPLCVSYPAIDGRGFGPGNHGVVCYYGDDRLPAHLFRVLRARELKVKLESLPLLSGVAYRNRYELAADLQERIAARFPGYYGVTGAGAYSDTISEANC